MKQKSTALERGTMLIFIAGCLWGSIGLFIRLMSDADSSAATISFLRMAFAFVILLVVTVLHSGISAFHVSRRVLFFSAMLGLVCHGVYNVFYQGVQQIQESSRVPVIASMETVTAALLGVLVLGEKLTVMHYLGITVVMASIVLMQRKQARNMRT